MAVDGKVFFFKYCILEYIYIDSVPKLRNFLTLWLSKVVIWTSCPDLLRSYRNFEKTYLKIVELKIHRLFNENVNLLPVYTII